MSLVSFDINHQCVRRATPCPDGASEIVLLSRIPLHVSLQQCIEHIAPHIVETVSHVQVVTVQDESKTFGLLLRCISAIAASNLATSLDNSVGPSTFSETRIAATQVVNDVMPAKQPVSSGHRRGNSPLLHPSDPTTVCSICLDAADALSSGCPIITTICAHTFHLHCIAKCTHGEPCPLCRFDMLLLEGTSECGACGDHNDLWMCLVCGAVNCGRNKLGHAFEHFRSTTHSHACQVGGSRVWDYEADAFVHHLAIPEEGGAPVPTASSARWCDNDDELMDEVLLQSKIEVVNEYYSRILNSQLEQQQRYFEGMLTLRSGQSVLQLEHVERVAIMRQAVYEMKGLVSAFASTMKTLLHSYQKRAHQAVKQREFLQTTLASLEDGNEKLQTRVDNFRPAVLTASSGRIVELEREVERLFAELSK
jgi:hypothetical protein